MRNTPDKETILITLDQLDQTLEVLTSVVCRLKKDIASMDDFDLTDEEETLDKTLTATIEAVTTAAIPLSNANGVKESINSEANNSAAPKSLETDNSHFH